MVYIFKKLKIFLGIMVAVFMIGLFFYLYFVANKKDIRKEPLVPSEQEQAVILNQPSAGTEAEYSKLIEKYASSTQTLNIGQNCQMNPLVIKFKGDSTLVIANNDSVKHVISFENRNFFSVSPGDKREINIQKTYGFDPGAWRYRCGDLASDRNVGVMYLSQ